MSAQAHTHYIWTIPQSDHALAIRRGDNFPQRPLRPYRGGSTETLTVTEKNPTNLATRLWRKDVSIWPTLADSADPISARLGWLDSIGWLQSRAGELQAWAAQIVSCGDYDRVILLGMGGSSLAPAVFASLFAPARGALPLTVIDTTNPDEITRLAGRAGDLRRCLFIVSSKSGTSVETVDLYSFFHAQLAAHCPAPESRFVIITDEGSALHQLGESRKFNKIFLNPADIGGRYSALSYFGMVPAVLLGVDAGKLLQRAWAFCETTKSDDPKENPSLALGMLLGRGALAGRDKLILNLPGQLGAFGLWIEQLIAESTGKDGKGLVPVVAVEDLVGEDLAGDNLNYAGGEDRINISIEYSGAGHEPGKRRRASDHALRLDDPYQIGAEYFRWEFATAIAAGYLRVNPFDQPDVAQTKNSTRRFIDGRARLPAPSCRGDDYDLHYHAAGRPQSAGSTREIIAEFRRTLTPKNYLGLLAYLPEGDQTLALLHRVRKQVAGRPGMVATVGFGPRYLHSTGQLHKGGPPTGRFIQFIVDSDVDSGTNPGTDLPVPGRGYTFGRLYRAQADGDFSALAGLGAGIMRVGLKADRLRALAAFVSDFAGPD